MYSLIMYRVICIIKDILLVKGTCKWKLKYLAMFGVLYLVSYCTGIGRDRNHQNVYLSEDCNTVLYMYYNWILNYVMNISISYI